jgi:antitoxin Phd
MVWRLAVAKIRFVEVFDRAFCEGPQRIVRRGNAAILISERDYEKLKGKRPDFKEFLLAKGPSFDHLDLIRDRSPMRDVKL